MSDLDLTRLAIHASILLERFGFENVDPNRVKKALGPFLATVTEDVGYLPAGGNDPVIDTCPHGLIKGMMTCPTCEPEAQAAAEKHALAAFGSQPGEAFMLTPDGGIKPMKAYLAGKHPGNPPMVGIEALDPTSAEAFRAGLLADGLLPEEAVPVATGTPETSREMREALAEDAASERMDAVEECTADGGCEAELHHLDCALSPKFDG